MMRRGSSSQFAERARQGAARARGIRRHKARDGHTLRRVLVPEPIPREVRARGACRMIDIRRVAVVQLLVQLPHRGNRCAGGRAVVTVATLLGATLCLCAMMEVRLRERSDRRGSPGASVTIRAPTAARLTTDQSPVSTSKGVPYMRANGTERFFL
jgi:hypothetical protein